MKKTKTKKETQDSHPDEDAGKEKKPTITVPQAAKVTKALAFGLLAAIKAMARLRENTPENSYLDVTLLAAQIKIVQAVSTAVAVPEDPYVLEKLFGALRGKFPSTAQLQEVKRNDKY